MKTVLTIAGFDPSSGAGVTADLLVFAAHGLFGTSCITSLTVQSTLGVQSTHSVEAAVVADTLACLDADLPPSGIKVGMMATAANVLTINNYLQVVNDTIERLLDQDAGRPFVVVDPVLRSSSGRELLESDGVEALRNRLLMLTDWVTPNIEELEILSGQPIHSADDVVSACRVLQARTSRHACKKPLGVLATGGHLDPPDDLLLTPDGDTVWLRGVRVNTTATHGTGCALSSAFLSSLVLGEDSERAARSAKRYVEGALTSAQVIGHGRGPMNHLWPLLNPTP